jgi:hypothetical protein
LHSEERLSEHEPPDQISATGRLFELCSRAVQVNGNLSVTVAWAVLATNQEQEIGRGFDLLAHAFRLIEESKQEVLRRPEIKQELFMRSINSVEQIFRSANYANQWSSISAPLQQALNALEFSAERLNAFSDERLLPQSEIAGLLGQLEIVYRALLNSDVESSLKQELLKQLDQIRTALVEYRVRGAEAVVSATNSSVGLIVRLKDKIAKVATVKEINDFLDLVVKLEAVATRIVAYTTIGAPAIQALLTSGQGIAQ